ncbi:hypothetical protein H7B90_15870 [Cohnella xylanilytica]|uniref:Uncharacterized protein n=1 Tax=Cohnella xylanilytica TaxID=557555 RepID=A0A841U129_9BACL|nr:hypothetical protein [Cohnella xylanilytica]
MEAFEAIEAIGAIEAIEAIEAIGAIGAIKAIKAIGETGLTLGYRVYRIRANRAIEAMVLKGSMPSSADWRFRPGMKKPPRSARRDGSGTRYLVEGLINPGARAEDDDQQDEQDERECGRSHTAVGSTNWIAHSYHHHLVYCDHRSPF